MGKALPTSFVAMMICTAARRELSSDLYVAQLLQSHLADDTMDQLLSEDVTSLSYNDLVTLAQAILVHETLVSSFWMDWMIATILRDARS